MISPVLGKSREREREGERKKKKTYRKHYFAKPKGVEFEREQLGK